MVKFNRWNLRSSAVLSTQLDSHKCHIQRHLFLAVLEYIFWLVLEKRVQQSRSNSLLPRDCQILCRSAVCIQDTLNLESIVLIELMLYLQWWDVLTVAILLSILCTSGLKCWYIFLVIATTSYWRWLFVSLGVLV